jgi:exopolysaccharide biosynthesis polyprenyl glycosylphosphotransferase
MSGPQLMRTSAANWPSDDAAGEKSYVFRGGSSCKSSDEESVRFIFVDMLCIIAAVAIGNNASHPARVPIASTLAVLGLYTFSTLQICSLTGQFRWPIVVSAAREQRRMAMALGASTALWSIVAIGISPLSPTAVMISGVLAFLFMSICHTLRRRSLQRRVETNQGGRKVLIVGATDTGRELREFVCANPHLGMRVVGFCDNQVRRQDGVLGSLSSLEYIATSLMVDEIFICNEWKREDLLRTVRVLEPQGVNITVISSPRLFERGGYEMGPFQAVPLRLHRVPLLGKFAKRLMDIVFSAAALVVLAPLLALVALAIKLDSSGPVLYSSTRIGRRGRKFKCLKLRTMVQDADEQKARLHILNERKGPFFKMARDPRITRLGKVLRRYSIDEMPQFWNVLLGDMSLVGPRPHPLDDCEKYGHSDLRRLQVSPGLTGLWQVTARRDPSFERAMSLDLEYIDNWSLMLDLKILLKTIPVVCGGMGQ